MKLNKVLLGSLMLLTNGISANVWAQHLATPNTQIKQEITAEQLLANPKLLERAMYSVLRNQNIAQIQVILPIYERSPNPDADLVNFAKALIAHSEKNYGEAVNYYRKVINVHPYSKMTRLYLASALLNDKQYDAALSQYERLKHANLPVQLHNQIIYSILGIKGRENWRFGLSGYYVLSKEDDKNKRGIHLDLWANKRFNLKDNFYTGVNLSSNSEIYFNQHQDDWHSLYSALNFGYEDANKDLRISPFYKYALVDKHKYSHTTGVKFLVDYNISDKLESISQVSLGRETLAKKYFYSGKRHNFSQTFVYSPSANTSLSFGGSFYQYDARDDYDNYSKKSLHLGWGQDWWKGISSRVSLTFSKRIYKAENYFKQSIYHSMTNKNLSGKREDKEIYTSISVWKRAWHFWGLTPKLTWSHSKIRSNDPFEGGGNTNMYIEFSRDF